MASGYLTRMVYGCPLAISGTVGGHALYHRRGVRGDFLHGEAEALRDRRIDLETDGRAAHCVLQAVEDIDHAALLLDGVGDTRSYVLENCGIGIEELDLDGFGGIG